MKRQEITISFDDYIRTFQHVQKLQTIENGNQVNLQLMSRETANKHWAAIQDLQNLFILMKRAQVSVKELEEWIKDAAAIRRGFDKPALNQKKLF